MSIIDTFQLRKSITRNADWLVKSALIENETTLFFLFSWPLDSRRKNDDITFKSAGTAREIRPWACWLLTGASWKTRGQSRANVDIFQERKQMAPKTDPLNATFQVWFVDWPNEKRSKDGAPRFEENQRSYRTRAWSLSTVYICLAFILQLSFIHAPV